MTTITIDLGTRKIELTPEEARTAYAALIELLGVQKGSPVMIPYPVYPCPALEPLSPYPWNPVYCQTTGTPLPKPNTIIG